VDCVSEITRANDLDEATVTGMPPHPHGFDNRPTSLMRRLLHEFDFISIHRQWLFTQNMLSR
jgi:hypothetical protein